MIAEAILDGEIASRTRQRATSGVSGNEGESMKDLRGANAIVTGASRGIGVYIARALAQKGVNLSLAARSVDELEQVRAEMEALGVEAVAIPCDVAKSEDRADLLGRTEEELGPIDILVNNAGIERVARFDEAPESDFTESLAVNLEAPILLTRAVVPGMLERGRGHVVNIASGAGKIGVPFATSYCASKHGLVGFTSALRCEYRGQPVGFSVVCPGFVTDVGMYSRWEEAGLGAPKIAGSSTPEKVASVTIDCIEHDRAEVTVNTPPVRPLIVLANMMPSLVPPVMQLLGYSKTFARVAGAEVPPD
jgi:short-subunit dehydrogenase